MKYHPEVTDRYLAALQSGHSIESAARIAGVAKSTVYVWKGKYPDFAAKEREALAARTELVEDALYANAIGGNTTAQIFWLKNRTPQRWRQTARVEGRVIMSAVDLVRELEQSDQEADESDVSKGS